MKIEIKIPAMGESIVEATIGNILKPSGSLVRAGEEILEIETDKVNQVLSAPDSGLLQLDVKTGDTVQVGKVIGSIDVSAKGEKEASPKKEEPKTEAPRKESAPASEKIKEPSPPPQEKNQGGETPIRKTIDASLEEIKTPSPKAASVPMPQPEAQPAPNKGAKETRKKMTKLRRIIAERLVDVKNQTAMLTTFNEVDMSVVMAVREKEQEQFQKKHGIKLGFMSFFAKACVAALQKFPEVNARIDRDEIVYPNFFNIGVAVSTEKGLMVPVLRNVDLLSYAEIEKQLKSFAEKARNGTISVDDMQGGTFTITNGGVFGSLLSTPILNPPQSAILGMHNIVKRPIAVNDQVEIRPMMYLALSYDHRIVDGRDSIQFLMHIKQSLEEPTRRLLDL